MKKLMLLLLILTLTSWTYEKPKKQKEEHHTLPVGDGWLFMCWLGVAYGIKKGGLK